MVGICFFLFISRAWDQIWPSPKGHVILQIGNSSKLILSEAIRPIKLCRIALCTFTKFIQIITPVSVLAPSKESLDFS